MVLPFGLPTNFASVLIWYFYGAFIAHFLLHYKVTVKRLFVSSHSNKVHSPLLPRHYLLFNHWSVDHCIHRNQQQSDSRSKREQSPKKKRSLQYNSRGSFWGKQRHKVLFFVMMSRKQIRLHLQSWFYIWNVENFNIVDILYVVGGTCNPFCDNSFLDITYANPHKNINFLSLHRIADEEINSPEKLFEALDYISGHMTYNYAFNVHPRTYANVRSLVKMLKGNSPFEALYIGRPKVISLHSYDSRSCKFA
jgi:hypothetical protein